MAVDHQNIAIPGVDDRTIVAFNYGVPFGALPGFTVEPQDFSADVATAAPPFAAALAMNLAGSRAVGRRDVDGGSTGFRFQALESSSSAGTASPSSPSAMDTTNRLAEIANTL